MGVSPTVLRVFPSTRLRQAANGTSLGEDGGAIRVDIPEAAAFSCS